MSKAFGTGQLFCLNNSNKGLNSCYSRTTYLSIADYVKSVANGECIPNDRITPLDLAEDSERDGLAALEQLDRVRRYVNRFSGALECEILDVEAWSCLSLYFAEKLRAGVALETFRRTADKIPKEKAVDYLEKALRHWDRVIEATRVHYDPTPHVYAQIYEWSGNEHLRESEGMFSWEGLRDQVLRDIELAQTAQPIQK